MQKLTKSPIWTRKCSTDDRLPAHTEPFQLLADADSMQRLDCTPTVPDQVVKESWRQVF